MTVFQILEDAEIELPSYMKTIEIDANEIDSHNYGPIISCGLVPNTKELIMLVSNGDIYELDVIKFFSTQDVGYEAFPIFDGKLVEFIREDIIVTVDSKDLLDASRKIQLTNLKIGMKHEDEIINLEEDYQGRMV